MLISNPPLWCSFNIFCIITLQFLRTEQSAYGVIAKSLRRNSKLRFYLAHPIRTTGSTGHPSGVMGANRGINRGQSDPLWAIILIFGKPIVIVVVHPFIKEHAGRVSVSHGLWLWSLYDSVSYNIVKEAPTIVFHRLDFLNQSQPE